MKSMHPFHARLALKTFNLSLCTVALFSLTNPVLATDSDFNQQLKNALEKSQVSAHFRYRLEHVEQDNALQDGLASTLRSRITLNTGPVSGFSALLQVDNVSRLGGDTYNSTVNGQTRYSVIADPTGSDFNQALIRYQNNHGTTFSAGRQLVNQLNQRFLGGVAWRQNEQTLDGYRLQQQLPANVSVDLGHYYNVNRVFGPKGPQADQQGSFNTALLQWQWQQWQQVSGFIYDFDFDHWSARSSLTQGLHYQGQFAALPALQLQASVAVQQDAHTAPIDYRHHYHRLHAQYKFTAFALAIGQERLAGDGVTAFQTPLATLHAFQGFADLFLTTPNQGLRDNHIQLSLPVHAANLSLAWHRFSADAGSDKYGSELNVTASYKLAGKLDTMLKLARYQADSFGVDTNKVWLMLSYQL